MGFSRSLTATIFTLFLLGNLSHAQPLDDAYSTIKPAQPTHSGDKIEVAEIFWYGCPHCFSLEPHIHAWKQALADDVAFRLVPGVLNQSWIPHARAFYAAQKMGALETLHTPLFQALHQKSRKIFNRDSLIDFAEEVGIDKKEFIKHYDSNETEIKVKQAFLLARNIRLTGVPAVMVNGKYLVSASRAGSFENMLAVINHLIDLERAQ